jgi:hypothetical protein
VVALFGTVVAAPDTARLMRRQPAQPEIQTSIEHADLTGGPTGPDCGQQ